MKGSEPHADILIVDDSEADLRMAKEVFATAPFPNTIHVARDGEHALQFLRRQGEFEESLRPDMIILDINMPKMNGHETLRAIRADPELAPLPVVMLTSSDAPEDVQQARESRADCYIQKPVDLDAYFQVVYDVADFWHALQHS